MVEKFEKKEIKGYNIYMVDNLLSYLPVWSININLLMFILFHRVIHKII